MQTYFEKIAGAGAAGQPLPPWSHTAWSALGSFSGMAVVGLIHTYFVAPDLHHPLLIAAFGAMSVLLFSAIEAPASQPYNTIVGNSMGALVGVLVVLLMQTLGHEQMFWLSGALSVSLTIAAQELTNSQHPPGGATALIFAIIMPMHKERFYYVLTPALLGAIIMVVMATIMNNMAPSRQYPQFWSPIKLSASEGARKGQQQTLVQEEAEAEGNTSEEDCEQSMLGAYIGKFRGSGKEAGPKPKLSEVFFSFLGSFAGMGVLGLLHTYVFLPYFHMTVDVAAFGAMSVLIFSLSKSPLAQPTNTIIGNSIGGAVGVLMVDVMSALGLENKLWLGGALSVAFTIAIQERTKTVHPPGGATALLYTITPAMQKLGRLYVFAPAFVGALIMVLMGVIMNNISPNRCYPQRWLFDDSSSYTNLPAQEMTDLKKDPEAPNVSVKLQEN